MDAPSDRKAHTIVTPSFGGVGIFLGLTLISLLLIPSADMDQFRYVFASLGVVFLLGARDDLDPLKPYVKLIGQLICALLLVFFADIRLTGLHGIFGIHEMEYWTSVGVTSVLFIFLINSFNLIDGIDALCASVSIFGLSVMGTWFYANGEMAYMILAFSTAGATLAFLKFNISPSKIFMGDTGSLVLGAVSTILVISMIELNSGFVSFSFESVVSVATGIMILPVFDTIRVFIHRIINGKSPFNPDKNHIHHLLLETGLNHMQSTAILLIVNTGFLILSLELQQMDQTLFIALALALAYVLTQAIHFSIYLKGRDILRTEP